MKRYLIFGLICMTLSGIVEGSGYPPGYGDQIVYVAHKGPALLAHIGGGNVVAEVIGYKKSGYLSKDNPNSITAVAISQCSGSNGTQFTQKTEINLGRERHGKGYMSNLLYFEDLVPAACRYQMKRPTLQIAFLDEKGNWDSVYGRNYTFYHEDIYGNSVTFNTHESGNTVNQQAWEFIVGQMTHP